jgi:hypothetical protein
MVDLNCRVSVDEQMHDFAQSAADKDADLTLEIARKNGDLDRAVEILLKQKLNFGYVLDSINFDNSSDLNNVDLTQRANIGQFMLNNEADLVRKIILVAVEKWKAKDDIKDIVNCARSDIKSQLEEYPHLIEEAIYSE